MVNWRNSMVADILKNHPKLPYVEGKSMLESAYIQAYGLFDFLKQEQIEMRVKDANVKKPLSQIALYPGEDRVSTTRFDKVVDEYMDLKIYELYGLSLDAFLSLPLEYSGVLKTRAKRFLDRKANADQTTLSSIEASIQSTR